MSERLDRTRHEKIAFAREVRDNAVRTYAEMAGEPVRQHNEQVLTDSAFYRCVLNLRLEIEKNGEMDYRLLAERLWRTLEGKQSRTLNDPYDIFVNSMIARIQDAPVQNMLYPHVLTAMPELIRRHKDSIAHLSLWSQGDVSRTGYQVAHVEHTNIVRRFMKAVVTAMGGNDRRAFLEKTKYDVADDKFKNIVDYAEQRLDTDQGPLKLVIIDDRVENYEVVKKRIRAKLGAKAAERVDVIPIWAVYGRRGSEEKAQAAAAGQTEAFVEKKRSYNAIESFDELLDEERFREIFRGAHLFVDFDGVIANDANARQLHVNAIFSACIDGLSKAWGLSRDKTALKIHEQLTRDA